MERPGRAPPSLRTLPPKGPEPEPEPELEPEQPEPAEQPEQPEPAEQPETEAEELARLMAEDEAWHEEQRKKLGLAHQAEPATEASVRDQLVAIYEVHRPSKIADIATLMLEWAGDEDELLAGVSTQQLSMLERLEP